MYQTKAKRNKKRPSSRLVITLLNIVMVPEVVEFSSLNGLKGKPYITVDSYIDHVYFRKLVMCANIVCH